MIAYTGNGAYCYADSLHMSLKAAGMNDLPTPGFLECLTTMPFGCLYIDRPDNPLFFPNGANIDPDRGLTLAVEALGWACDETFDGEHDAALARLREALKVSPVLAGPLDMGYLTHNPEYQYQSGTDHFVLVIEADAERVLLHDPGWYPYATLPTVDFMEAWRGEHIDYGRHTYMMRWNFRQTQRRSRRDMIDHVLPTIRRSMTNQPNVPTLYSGVKALELFTAQLRKEVSPDFRGLLLYFALPLGAKRCNDAAAFFCEADLNDAAVHIDHKARLYGETQYYAAKDEWLRVADIVEQMIEVERQIIEAI